MQAILLLQTQAVIIDELADTNIPGSMEVTVRVADKILQLADEVVNIDLIAEALTIFFSQKNYYSFGNLP